MNKELWRLIPEPVWCTERQHPAYSPPQLGVGLWPCGQHTWHGCCCLLVCSPVLPPWMPWQPELSQGPLLQRATTWSLGNTWGLICSLCCALSPYSFDPEEIGPPLCPPFLPVVTSGVVQDGAHFCQHSASALGPLKHVNAEDPFSAASHTFLSF